MNERHRTSCLAALACGLSLCALAACSADSGARRASATADPATSRPTTSAFWSEASARASMSAAPAPREPPAPTATPAFRTLPLELGRPFKTPIEIAGGTIVNVGATLTGMKGGIRGCYARALLEEPEMSGSLQLTLAVGPSGWVRSATVVATSGSLSATVVGCIQGRGAALRFAPPDPSDATILASLNLEPPSPPDEPSVNFPAP